MKCRYIKPAGIQCRNKTSNPHGYCHLHTKKIEVEDTFMEPKPCKCPICWNSLFQVTRPLQCGHWAHKTCIKRTSTVKIECPVCRTYLSELDNFQEPVVNESVIIFAGLMYKLYRDVLSPVGGGELQLGLSDFINAVLNTFENEQDPFISIFLYAQTLSFLMNH